MKYRQCYLEKVLEDGYKYQVSYIPAKYAVVGKVLKLKDHKDVWEDGWVVKSAGELTDEDLLPDPHKQIREHRKRTGDSLPK